VKPVNADAPSTTPQGRRAVTLRRICLTPTRNEGWIIQRFLAAAKCWADDIIVADQGSIDGPLEVAQGTAGVIPVVNSSPVFDEVHRQQLLINAARGLAGRRLLIALDADEALSANCVASRDWERIAAAAPGTMVRMKWVNILPGFSEAWIPREPTAFGLVDDGAPHKGRRIHNPRLPWRNDAPVLDLDDIVVLHFQYVVWERMVSKQRWYQAWEHTKHNERGPLEIFRMYNHMHGGWKREDIYPLRREWLDGYERAGVNFRSLACESVTWWDREIAFMLKEHGTDFFRRIAIWDKDWNALAPQIGIAGADFRDPRSMFEKFAHRCLAISQKRRANPFVRVLEKLLRFRGW
jgi:hypothetical protein